MQGSFDDTGGSWDTLSLITLLISDVGRPARPSRLLNGPRKVPTPGIVATTY